MGSGDDPPHDDARLGVPLGSDGRFVLTRESPNPVDEFFDLLSSNLEEPAGSSDDERQPRNADKVVALLEANAELRALALKLSDMLDGLLVDKEVECGQGCNRAGFIAPDSFLVSR